MIDGFNCKRCDRCGKLFEVPIDKPYFKYRFCDGEYNFCDKCKASLECAMIVFAKIKLSFIIGIFILCTLSLWPLLNK